MSNGRRRQRRIKPVAQNSAPAALRPLPKPVLDKSWNIDLDSGQTVSTSYDVAYAPGTSVVKVLRQLERPAPHRPSRRLPLMDEVHSWTFSSKLSDKKGNLKIPDAALTVMRRYRMSLRKCDKFVLDDDAVQLTCEMSIKAQAKNDDLLRGWSYIARLPYDDFWVEFDQHVRCRTFEQLGTLRGKFDPSTVAQVIGYQFERDTDDPASPRWVMREFTRSSEGVLPGLLAFVFDPEATEAEPVRSSRRWRLPTLSDRPGMPRIPGQITVDGSPSSMSHPIAPEDVILGTLERRDDKSDGAELFLGLDRRVDSHTIFAPRFLRAKFATIVDPFWSAYFSAIDNTEERRQKTSRILAQEVLEQAGTARWVITLLAAINAVPRDVVPMSVTPGRRQVGANILPYFQHRTISIRLPRDNRIVHALQHVERFARERNAPRAWHEVRGHWRIIERGRVPLRGRGQAWCQHVPEATDESGTGLCGKCGLLIRWVTKHHRGDPNVGIVDHTYRVTAKKRSAVR